MFETIPVTRQARWRLMDSIIREWLRPLTKADRLFVIGPDGKNLERYSATPNTNGNVYPAWSPDCKKIACGHLGRASRPGPLAGRGQAKIGSDTPGPHQEAAVLPFIRPNLRRR
jgi:hypothetical protein